jgi:hypothetical protein
MAAVVPNIRLVYVLRHPVQRMVSEYVHHRATGEETLPLVQAMLQRSRYFLISSYAMQLEQYLQYFPREQIVVCTSEELRAERERVVRDVLCHIGVADQGELPDLSDEANAGVERRALRGLPARHPAGWGRILDKAPRRTGRLLHKIGSRRMNGEELQLPAEVNEALTELVRPEVSRLRNLLGGEFEGWGIA